jgi:hypothetical protein
MTQSSERLWFIVDLADRTIDPVRCRRIVRKIRFALTRRLPSISRGMTGASAFRQLVDRW